MSQLNIKGLAHIGIFVKDIDKSIDFYKRLGFTLDKEENIGVRLAFLSAGTCLIELVDKIVNGNLKTSQKPIANQIKNQPKTR
jgi:catechol 2,3-dioxygenase-like lactoylglutathione lyase family enzyme